MSVVLMVPVMTGWMAAAHAADVDRVPEDFPSLQAAVEDGGAPRIELGPGRWAGAVVDRPVHIVGAEGAVIDQGVPAGRLVAALHLVAGADGATVEGLRVDCHAQVDAGVFASERRGGLPVDVVVRGNRFEGCVQGVTVAGRRTPDGVPDALWWVEGNRFVGLSGAPLRGGQGGVLGVIAKDVALVDIVGNRFAGWADRTRGFASAEVAVVGCERCAVVEHHEGMVGGQHHAPVAVEGGEELWLAP